MTAQRAPEPGSKEWHEKRRNFMGASDAAVPLKLHPYTTEYELYLDKRGLLEDQEETEAMHRGHVLEEPIAQAYEIKATLPIKLASSKHVIHPIENWMACTPDKFNYIDNSLVQIKTVNRWAADSWGEDGTDQIPQHVLVQVMHEMACTGAETVDVVALIASEDFFQGLVYMVEAGMPVEDVGTFIAGLDLRIYRIDRDDDLIAMIMKEEWNFWSNHVLAGIEPELDGSSACRAHLAKVYPDCGEVREARDNEINILNAYREAEGMVDVAEAARDKLKNDVVALIGNDAGLTWDNSKVTNKPRKGRKKIDYKGIIEEWEIPDSAVEKYTTAGEEYWVFNKTFK